MNYGRGGEQQLAGPVQGVLVRRNMMDWGAAEVDYGDKAIRPDHEVGNGDEALWTMS